MPVTDMSELRVVYPPPKAQARLKVLDHLDVHCRDFIALSPFYVISSARLDPKTLLLPDRPGNRQVDTMQNLVERPYVGLLFFVPGMTETLRINGKADIVTDQELLAPLTVKGKAPVSGLKITVEEAFLHCAKALIRARLWDVDSQIDRSRYPTYGRVLADQIAGTTAAKIDAGEAASCRDELY